MHVLYKQIALHALERNLHVGHTLKMPQPQRFCGQEVSACKLTPLLPICCLNSMSRGSPCMLGVVSQCRSHSASAGSRCHRVRARSDASAAGGDALAHAKNAANACMAAGSGRHVCVSHLTVD